MTTGARMKAQLPMVRLHLVMPLVQELERLRIDASKPLAQLSVRRKDVENRDLFVPAPKMYAIVEKLAEFSEDRYFGVHVGERLDPWNWSPPSTSSQLSVRALAVSIAVIIRAEPPKHLPSALLSSEQPESIRLIGSNREWKSLVCKIVML